MDAEPNLSEIRAAIDAHIAAKAARRAPNFRDLHDKAITADPTPLQPWGNASWGFDINTSITIETSLGREHEFSVEASIAVAPDGDWWITDISIEGGGYRKRDNPLALAIAQGLLDNAAFIDRVETDLREERALYRRRG